MRLISYVTALLIVGHEKVLYNNVKSEIQTFGNLPDVEKISHCVQF